MNAKQTAEINAIVSASLAAAIPTIIDALRPTFAASPATVAAVTAAPTNDQESNVMNATARRAAKTAPKTAKHADQDRLAKFVDKHDVLGTDSVTGTITALFRKGNAAHLDTTGEQYQNCTKFAPALFAPFAIGSRVTVERVTYAQESETFPTRTVVTSVAAAVNAASTNAAPKTARAAKTAPKTVAAPTTQPARSTAAVAAPTAARSELAAIRQSVPSSKRPDGCRFCGGAVHGNVGSGTAANECQIRQYINATGQPFQPALSSSLRALADWKDSLPELWVSKGNDDTDGIELIAWTARREAATTAAPSKPAKSAPRTGSGTTAAPVKSANPMSDTVAVGKLLKLNNAGTKIQFQPSGKLFVWLTVREKTAKIAAKFVGKSVQVTYDANEKIALVVVAAPKV